MFPECRCSDAHGQTRRMYIIGDTRYEGFCPVRKWCTGRREQIEVADAVSAFIKFATTSPICATLHHTKPTDIRGYKEPKWCIDGHDHSIFLCRRCMGEPKELIEARTARIKFIYSLFPAIKEEHERFNKERGCQNNFYPQILVNGYMLFNQDGTVTIQGGRRVSPISDRFVVYANMVLGSRGTGRPPKIEF